MSGYFGMKEIKRSKFEFEKNCLIPPHILIHRKTKHFVERARTLIAHACIILKYIPKVINALIRPKS